MRSCKRKSLKKYCTVRVDRFQDGEAPILLIVIKIYFSGFPQWLIGKESPCQRQGLIPENIRDAVPSLDGKDHSIRGVGNCNPFQYSSWENSCVSKSQKQLSMHKNFFVYVIKHLHCTIYTWKCIIFKLGFLFFICICIKYRPFKPDSVPPPALGEL